MLKNNTLAIALAALLVGGVATAAFMNNRDKSATADVVPPASLATDANGDQIADDAGLPAGGKVEYADVVRVEPITKKEQLYAQVIGTEPVRETSTTSTPQPAPLVSNAATTSGPRNRSGKALGSIWRTRPERSK